MKDDVYEKFATKALTYLDGTEAFLKEQLPDYFQQVVTFYAIQSWVFLALSVLMLCGSAVCGWQMVKSFKRSSDYEHDEPYIYMPLMAAAIILLVFGGAGTVKNTKSALKATYAPKVFIVDYLRGKE